MKADLVLEGGGVKGIGLVGAITRLEQDFAVERVAGTSVGALNGAWFAGGGTPDDLAVTGTFLRNPGYCHTRCHQHFRSYSCQCDR